MKYVNLIIGLVIFATSATIIFSIMGDIGSFYNSNDFHQYHNLTGEYTTIINETSPISPNSNLENISTTIDAAQVQTNVIIPGAKEAVAAAKLIKGTWTTMTTIIPNVISDLEFQEYKNTIVTMLYIISGIFILFIIFVIIRGVQPEV